LTKVSGTGTEAVLKSGTLIESYQALLNSVQIRGRRLFTNMASPKVVPMKTTDNTPRRSGALQLLQTHAITNIENGPHKEGTIGN